MNRNIYRQTDTSDTDKSINGKFTKNFNFISVTDQLSDS